MVWIVVIGVGAVLSAAVFAGLVKSRRRRSSQAMSVERAAACALPDFRNGYVRERLAHGLCGGLENRRERSDLRFVEAYALLAALRERRLSAVDEIKTRRTENAIGRYASKEELDAFERAELGEVFCGILTLCAKYGV